jgi:hypothetical protein
MISLASPITISPAPINGKAIKPIVLNQIDWSVSYDSSSATAFIRGANVPLRLWDSNTTPTYTQAGQFTDTDVQNRITELLGSTPADIEKNLLALYPQPSTPKVAAQPKPIAHKKS